MITTGTTEIHFEQFSELESQENLENLLYFYASLEVVDKPFWLILDVQLFRKIKNDSIKAS